MRITKIEICDFGAFPGPHTILIDLGAKGKNLLVSGENGSGKSSLSRALIETLSLKPKHFKTFRNIFAKGAANVGFVRLHFDDRTSFALSASDPDPPPIPPAPIADAARWKGCLDYRSLLRTNFLHHGRDRVNIFVLVVELLLSQRENPITTKRICDEWAFINEKAKGISELYERNKKPGRPLGVKNLEAEMVKAIGDMSSAIQNLLPAIERKADALVKDFFPDLDVHLRFKAAPQYTPQKTHPESLIPGDIELEVKFRGELDKIRPHHVFLNEARLSAIALALYLAAMIVTVPQPPATGPTPLQLLVLDDVLIGLDIANRLPLLKLLDREFPNHQIILMTYDPVWAEMVRMRTDPAKWQYDELYVRVGHDGIEVPVHRVGSEGPDQFIGKARGYLAPSNPDERAAVLYTRLAFERKLKKFCSERSVPVPYDEDLRRVSSNDLWTAVKNERPASITGITAADLDMHRKVILNQFTHAATVTISGKEIEDAIDAVDKLKLT